MLKYKLFLNIPYNEQKFCIKTTFAQMTLAHKILAHTDNSTHETF